MRPVIAALFLALATHASAALMSDNCRVDLRFLSNANGVHAVVQVDATWRLVIDADLRLAVNGQVVKVEPVLTDTQQVFVVWLAPAGTTLSACATVEGRNWVTNEAWLPADSMDCAFHSGERQGALLVPRVPGRLAAARSLDRQLLRH